MVNLKTKSMINKSNLTDPNIMRMENERTVLNRYIFSTKNCKTIEEMREYLINSEKNLRDLIVKSGGKPRTPPSLTYYQKN